MPDSPLSPESQKALEELERVWKEQVAKGPPKDAGRGRPNPRMDPSEPFAIGVDEREMAALTGAPLDMDAIRGAAVKLLATFVDPAQARDRDVTAAGMAPDPQDFDRIFAAPWASAARQAYARTWKEPPVPSAKPEQTQIILVTVRPADLAERGLFSDRFPGAYRSIWDRLHPDSIWASWKFVEPGAAHGMFYDGLVWPGDRWLWVPKPWRLFEAG